MNTSSEVKTIGIVGLGYVGLPLAKAVHNAGFSIVACDSDKRKIDKLKEGELYLEHLDGETFASLLSSDKFTPISSSPEEVVQLKNADIIVICVPTPLGKDNSPDLTYVESVCHLIRDHGLRDSGDKQLIVLESTTYPGTTRNVVSRIINGDDVFENDPEKKAYIGYSPEREDPASKFSTSEIPKIVSGMSNHSSKMVEEFYSKVVSEVISVETPEIAEGAKLLENTYRAVNIGLINELKEVYSALGIDIWKVIDAASSKPFGFQPFYPGPGLGGHCIPIDPEYLRWAGEQEGCGSQFIELARNVNREMPIRVVEKIGEVLNERSKPFRGSQVLVLGMAYKKNVGDDRESPSHDVVNELMSRGAIVQYSDPHVPSTRFSRHMQRELTSIELTPNLLSAQDAVVILTDHDTFDYDMIAKSSPCIVDTRNALGYLSEISEGYYTA